MKKSQKHWYIIAYDIRDPKRLRRTHYYLKKRAVALQKSVFLLKADSGSLEGVLAGIKNLAHDREDDIRLYPVPNPHAIWVAGKQADALHNLFSGSPKQQPASLLGGLLNKIFQRKKT